MSAPCQDAGKKAKGNQETTTEEKDKSDDHVEICEKDFKLLHEEHSKDGEVCEDQKVKEENVEKLAKPLSSDTETSTSCSSKKKRTFNAIQETTIEEISKDDGKVVNKDSHLPKKQKHEEESIEHTPNKRFHSHLEVPKKKAVF